MLSILVPVYNFDVRNLISTLSIQCIQESIKFEIVVIDDASDEEWKCKNKSITSIRGVRYIEEKINLGRSKIRNKLAELSTYDSLIFLDSDSAITNSDFIKNYLPFINQEHVVYGGRGYFNSNVATREKLHWLYGIKREQASAEIRKIEPNRSFKTNNFLISKKIFNKIKFNEDITGYGHEDTLFGYELLKKNITIKHIDNPVIHIGLESSEEFLRKTREGIKNLKRIMKINGNEKRLVRDITILAYYKKLKKLGLEKPIQILYKRYEHVLRRNLLSKKPNLMVFDFYKLGYLCTINGK